MDRYVKITQDVGAAKAGEVYRTLSRDRASVEIITKDGRGHMARVWIGDKHYEYVEGEPSGKVIDLHDEMYGTVPEPTEEPTGEPEAKAKPTAKKK